VPPGYAGELPVDGYFVTRSPSFRNWVLVRAFVKNGDVAAAVNDVKAAARVYPLPAAANPPQTEFVDMSGKQFNTVHANDFHFYEELDAVIQHEPGDAFDPEFVGTLASIGIKKGKPFAPDERLKATLTDAVAVGNATARAISFAPRDKRAFIFPDRHWITPFIGGSYQFIGDGERILDARTMFHYMATGITPAMAAAAPGTGSAYAGTVRDANGEYLDGSKTYQVTLPAPIPAKQFWSFTVYSNQTRSMLETDQKLAGLDSTLPNFVMNPDGSATVWFAPTAPAGKEGNWVQTMPGKGFNVLFRLYGPLEPWFDQSWKPGDLEEIK
jgi:hypothetical protein